MIWFVVAVPLVIFGLLLEPRWVGWMVLGWFLVLIGFTLAMRWSGTRLRRAWADIAGQLGWQLSAVEPGPARTLAVPAVRRSIRRPRPST